MNNTPNVVFKYRQLTTRNDLIRFVDTINNHRIYFPLIRQLNDPFEGYSGDIHISFCGSSIYRATECEPPVIEGIKDQYRVLSLSEDCFSPQMWALYCNDYTGFCLCFSTEKTFNNIRKVDYLDRMDRGMLIDSFTGDLIEERLLEKQTGWSYESEWRIIGNNCSSFIDFDSNELVAIILGHKIDEETKRFVLSVIPDNLPVFITYPGGITGRIRLLPIDYQIPFDGSVPDFICTNKDLDEAIFATL